MTGARRHRQTVGMDALADIVSALVAAAGQVLAVVVAWRLRRPDRSAAPRDSRRRSERRSRRRRP
nr:MAG: hypothetical protein DIU52_13955 [bacterium]